MSSTAPASFAGLLAPTVPSTPPSSSPSAATVSVGLAVGLVICPVAFIFITVAFCRVARKGELFSRLPTQRLRREEAQRRRDYAKFMVVRGTFSMGSVVLSSSSSRGAGAGVDDPLGLLPLPYSLPTPPPPVYTRGTLLPPYEGRSIV